MVKKLSDNKVLKVISLYFQGHSQTDIANKLKITQASVSIYVGKFKTLAEKQGIMATAEEYGVMDQIKELYDLALDLRKGKKTVEETKNGLKMLLFLESLGFEEDQYGDLIQTYKKLNNDGYICAAVELTQMENQYDMSYEEIIEEAKKASDDLKLAQKELQVVHGIINSSNQDLENTKKQNEATMQELEAQMVQAGLDMNRLKLVETLAVTFNKAKISNGGLQDYIQRQQQLNKAEISIDVFAKILGKIKIGIPSDNGEKLLEMLTECNGLDQAINKLQGEEKTLSKEVSNLEQQAELKGELDEGIKNLKTVKAELEGHIGQLQKHEKETSAQLQTKELELGTVTQSYNTTRALFNQLTENMNKISDEIGEMKVVRHSLNEEIDSLVPRVTGLNQEHERLVKENGDLEFKRNGYKKQLEVTESFIGMVHASSKEDFKKNAAGFLEMLPALDQGKYSFEFLRNYVLKTLAGPELQILKCTKCLARFAVDKNPRFDGNYQCPVGGLLHDVIVDKDADEILKEALSQAGSRVTKITRLFKPNENDGQIKP